MNLFFLLLFVACNRPPTESPPESSDDSGDCAVEGEARIVCAAGDDAPGEGCAPIEEPTVRATLTCESYASSGYQQAYSIARACATDLGAECCVCSFDLDATCNPCEVND